MKRRLWIIILLAILRVSAGAQNVESIKNDGRYIYAEGVGLTPRIADSISLESLSAVLARYVDLPYSPAVRKEVLRTFIPEMRLVTKQVQYHGMTGNTSFRYLERGDIERLFSARSKKIEEMLKVAENAEKNGRIDVLLRNLTWAEIMMESISPIDALGIARLSARRDDVIDGLKVNFKVVNKYDRHVVEISFLYNGMPVEALDYSFFDGKKWSGILSAKDGKGFVEIDEEYDVEKYRIKYEINPAHLKNVAAIVNQITDALSAVPGAESQVKPAVSVEAPIDYSEVKNKVMEVISRSSSSKRKDSINLTPVIDEEPYRNSVASICDAVTANDYGSVETLFTPEGYDVFLRLVQFGSARILDYEELNMYSLGSEVYVRSVPMVFSFKGNKRKFVENVVFAFDGNGKVSNLSFALEKDAVDNIVKQEKWSEQVRIILVSFLENYKTAYALKRLDFISSLYDDDALIITGRVLKRAGAATEFSKNKYVKLTKRSKAEYIKQLEKVFDSQEFINILFSDCKVVKLNKGEDLFGINIRQEYYSTTYSDEGYLFILADLSDTDRSLIHVRTWQEEPDAEFGIVGPYLF